jgi:hypothetical protein
MVFFQLGFDIFCLPKGKQAFTGGDAQRAGGGVGHGRDHTIRIIAAMITLWFVIGIGGFFIERYSVSKFAPKKTPAL